MLQQTQANPAYQASSDMNGWAQGTMGGNRYAVFLCLFDIAITKESFCGHKSFLWFSLLLCASKHYQVNCQISQLTEAYYEIFSLEVKVTPLRR